MPLLPALALAALAWDERDVNRIVRAYKPLRKHPDLFDATAGWDVRKPEDREAALLAIAEHRPR